jgi:hypothetical protein
MRNQDYPIIFKLLKENEKKLFSITSNFELRTLFGTVRFAKVTRTTTFFTLKIYNWKKD